MGGDADGDPLAAQRLDLVEERRDGRLAEPVAAAARVGDVKEHERDAGLAGRLGRRAGFGRTEVVELADRRVAGREHLAVGGGVGGPDEIRSLALGLREHAVAPGPEVATGGTAAQRTLERMAVRVDEAGQPQRGVHDRRRYTTGGSGRPARPDLHERTDQTQ